MLPDDRILRVLIVTTVGYGYSVATQILDPEGNPITKWFWSTRTGLLNLHNCRETLKNSTKNWKGRIEIRRCFNGDPDWDRAEVTTELEPLQGIVW